MYVKDSPTVGEYLHNETVGMLLLETSTANFYMAINMGRTYIGQTDDKSCFNRNGKGN